MTTLRAWTGISLCLVLALAWGGCGDEGVVAPPELTLDAADSPLPAGGNAKVKVVPPDGVPHGKTYGEWSTEWWQWILSAPLSENPALDETGACFDYGQEGPVWFVASNFGGTVVRDAVVPQGKSLLIGLAPCLAAAQLGDGRTEEELRAAAAAAADDVAGVYLEVDEQSVLNAFFYRFQSPEMFSYTLPDDNLMDYFGVVAPEGVYYPATSDGWFIMLPPLSEGAHQIHMIVLYPMPGIPSDVTINLVVGDALKRI